MGLLLPRQGDGIQYLVFVQVSFTRVNIFLSLSSDFNRNHQMPFAEDLRKPQFPSLTRLTTTKGKEVTQHPFLPTDQQNEAMASWVDALDLDLAGVDDEG